MRGGLSREEALAFYRETDGPNVCLCMERRLPADAALEMTAEGVLRPKKQ